MAKNCHELYATRGQFMRMEVKIFVPQLVKIRAR